MVHAIWGNDHNRAARSIAFRVDTSPFSDYWEQDYMVGAVPNGHSFLGRFHGPFLYLWNRLYRRDPSGSCPLYAGMTVSSSSSFGPTFFAPLSLSAPPAP
jgi:hypothetical protein